MTHSRSDRDALTALVLRVEIAAQQAEEIALRWKHYGFHAKSAAAGEIAASLREAVEEAVSQARRPQAFEGERLERRARR